MRTRRTIFTPYIDGESDLTKLEADFGLGWRSGSSHTIATTWQEYVKELYQNNGLDLPPDREITITYKEDKKVGRKTMVVNTVFKKITVGELFAAGSEVKPRQSNDPYDTVFESAEGQVNNARIVEAYKGIRDGIK